jgi:YD repeat-containing protein
VYDAANEVLTSEDASGVTTFSYDANGNTTGAQRQD